jgi:hypothetical protein
LPNSAESRDDTLIALEQSTSLLEVLVHMGQFDPVRFERFFLRTVPRCEARGLVQGEVLPPSSALPRVDVSRVAALVRYPSQPPGCSKGAGGAVAGRVGAPGY